MLDNLEALAPRDCHVVQGGLWEWCPAALPRDAGIVLGVGDTSKTGQPPPLAPSRKPVKPSSKLYKTFTPRTPPAVSACRVGGRVWGTVGGRVWGTVGRGGGTRVARTF